MKIILISDPHNKHKQIRWEYDPSGADMIICSGDASNLGQKDEMESFFNWFKKIPVQYKIFVAGNHDKCFDPKFYGDGVKGDKRKIDYKNGEWIKEIIADFTKYDSLNFYLENSGCEIEGIKLWGSPITPWFHGDWWAFNKHRGNEINEIWKQIPNDTDILITHGPPFGKMDYIQEQKLYVGCEDLLYHIKRVKPIINVFGHIHEGRGYDYDSNTHYFNASICNDQYEVVNKPYVIELNKEEREVQILNS